jgi:hypothetical protein
VKKRLILAGLIVVIGSGLAAVGMIADDEHDRDRFEFAPDTLVLSRSVYEGTAGTVTIGQTLPPGCVAGNVSVPNIPAPAGPGGSASVSVPANSNSGCTKAVDNGEYPNLNDTHSVWNNNTNTATGKGVDGSFGVTSPIFLDNLTTNGEVLNTLPIDPSRIVTSFSSKSELALNRSADGQSITFVGYHGGLGCPALTLNSTTGLLVQGTSSGPTSPTGPNLLDVSNSNTPGVCDPTNPDVSSLTTNTFPTAYYRSVAEVDGHGHLQLTDGNAYSGNNGRAAFKANWNYFVVGNDNNGGLSKTQLTTTIIGNELVTSTGAEFLMPGQFPPAPPNINMIGDFEVTQLGLGYPADKAGKDNNFRGLTIFNDTMYITKGSGSNGVNTVYQVGNPGVLPSGTQAQLEATPITILPGFPTNLASGLDKSGNPSPLPVAYPFGLWFADANTLYVCDEGDGTVVSPAVSGNVATTLAQTTAGVQKWRLINGTWVRQYVMNKGLNIGVPYSVANYPSALNPATGGCRNITGRHNGDGTVTIFAVTSTLSANGDQGADPNKLVKVTDILKAATLPTGDGDHDRDDQFGVFTTIRAARAGEVLRGVTFAPNDRDDDHDGFFGFGRGFGGFFNWF